MRDGIITWVVVVVVVVVAEGCDVSVHIVAMFAMC